MWAVGLLGGEEFHKSKKDILNNLRKEEHGP